MHQSGFTKAICPLLPRSVYSLEFGGIKIESPKCIANQISPFYVGTMRGTVSVTKKPRRSEVLNSFNVNEMAITHR